MNTSDLSTPNPEDLVRQTLHAKAREATIDLTFDEIRDDARRQRRRSGRRTALLTAAAVVVAVGAPTAFLLRPGDEAPGPAPQPTTSPSSPTASTKPEGPSGAAALEQIPQGRAPEVAYVHAGTVYLPDGSTTTLPDGTGPVTDFTGYHGGWLVGFGAGEDRVSWYDNTGTRQSDGPGPGTFAVSEDGTRTAYAQSGAIHIGITSGMGEGEQTVPGDARVLRPVGFLRGGDLVYQSGESEVAVTDGSTVPGMSHAHAVSAEADLIAGEDATGNTLVVTSTGRSVWTSSTWSVWGFSVDGKYAAATHTASQPDIDAFAILDARTGQVVAEHDSLPRKDHIGGTPVMDEDGSLLVAVTSGDLRQTVLRLDRDGTLTRATRVFRPAPGADSVAVDFATRP